MYLTSERSNTAVITSLVFLFGIALLHIIKSPLALPGTVIFALFVLFITFVNAEAALIILIFSMLLSPEFSIGGIPGRAVVIRLDDILLMLISFGWLARMAVNKELGLLKKSPATLPILIYIFICVVSSILGSLNGTTNLKHSFFYVLKYIEYFMVFFMAHNIIKDEDQVKRLVFFMLLTCIIVCVFALYSKFVLGIRATAPFEGEGGEANTLAGYLIIMIGLTSGIGLYSRSMKLRLLMAVLSVFFCIPFLFTLSRSGWLGFSAMYITFLLLSSMRIKVVLTLILLFFIVLAPVLLPKDAHQRFDATFVGKSTYEVLGFKITLDESASTRITSFHNSLKKWAQSPILGNGVPGGGVVSDVQYTRILREVGILGFLVFIWIMFALFSAGMTSYLHRDTNGFNRGLCLGFLGGLVGITAMGVGAEVFIIIRIMEPFWLLAAIVVAIPELSKSGEVNVEHVVPAGPGK